VKKAVGGLDVGTQFARFLIESEIARGEISVVYRVRNMTLKRTEALKVTAPTYSADPDFRARFRREALNAAVADHRHAVRVYDADEYDRRLYIAMWMASVCGGGLCGTGFCLRFPRSISQAR